MDNVAACVQRLQLGGLAPRPRHRARPSHVVTSDPHACMRRMLTRSFCSADSATYLHSDASTGCVTPVFQVAFASGVQSQLLAAADEAGFVSLVDTSRPSDGEATAQGVFQLARRKWLAHDNAIFDVCWSRDSAWLLTAAGDLRVCAWDVETQRPRIVLEKGHTMSVKCVRQSSHSDDVIASGSRDGNVLLWDARVPATPVARLLGVHNASVAIQSPFKQTTRSATSFVSPVGSHKRRKTAVATISSSPRSVTGLEFLSSGHELATAGTVDGTIKIWDLRRLLAPRKIPLASRSCVSSSALPVRTLSCGSRAGAQRGITSLALDATRSRLVASVANDDLCVFDIHTRRLEPSLRLNGHIAGSFYVRSTFSPDGDFVASGSADGVVFLWDARQRAASARAPLAALKGHGGEVNGVAWHARDFSRLATASDDGTVRVWTATRSDEAPEQSSGFRLTRKGHEWTNMSQLARQCDGRAYAVHVTEEEEEQEEAEGEVTSPPAIHRNHRALAIARPAQPPQPPLQTLGAANGQTPPRRVASQTLLDLWAR